MKTSVMLLVLALFCAGEMVAQEPEQNTQVAKVVVDMDKLQGKQWLLYDFSREIKKKKKTIEKKEALLKVYKDDLSNAKSSDKANKFIAKTGVEDCKNEIEEQRKFIQRLIAAYNTVLTRGIAPAILPSGKPWSSGGTPELLKDDQASIDYLKSMGITLEKITDLP